MFLEQSKRFGADEVVVADQQDVREVIHSVTAGGCVELVIDAAGAEEVIAHAMQVLRPRGKGYASIHTNDRQGLSPRPMARNV